MKLLGISGTITGAKTGIAVQKVLDAVRQKHADVDTELLDLKNYKVEFCDGRDPTAYGEDTKTVIDKVAGADFYVIGTPIFQASITGALKNLFDLLPVSALHNKVMGFVATGGTYQHYLVIENQLRPIAGFFRAYVAPGSVYLHDDHFDEKREIADPDVLQRIERLADELVFMQRRLKA